VICAFFRLRHAADSAKIAGRQESSEVFQTSNSVRGNHEVRPNPHFALRKPPCVSSHCSRLVAGCASIICRQDANPFTLPVVGPPGANDIHRRQRSSGVHARSPVLLEKERAAQTLDRVERRGFKTFTTPMSDQDIEPWFFGNIPPSAGLIGSTCRWGDRARSINIWRRNEYLIHPGSPKTSTKAERISTPENKQGQGAGIHHPQPNNQHDPPPRSRRASRGATRRPC